MAWTNPITWVTAVLTSAQMNQQVRDNLNETAPAKATTAGSHFVGTGLNAIAERIPGAAIVTTTTTTGSTSHVALTGGPSVTVTTGTSALVLVSVDLTNSVVSHYAAASVAVSGATTIAAADSNGVRFEPATANGVCRAGVGVWFSPATGNALTAGSNTFTMTGRVQAGGDTGSFASRTLIVIPF